MTRRLLPSASEIVKDGIRNEFATRTVPQVVSAERRELMGGMLTRARLNAAELGIRWWMCA